MKLIIFTAPSCHPCKRLKPILEREIEFRLLDSERIDIHDQKAFEKHSVTIVPTVICVDGNGKEIGRFSGGKPASVVSSIFDEWGL